MEYETILHQIAPVFAPDSRILILGSLPSRKSREANFFYGHPQNRFWRTLAAVLGEAAPETIEEKKKMLLSHRIALWDVIASCEIRGSSDSSIRNARPNDLAALIAKTQIEKVFTVGATATKLYQKLCEADTQIKTVMLPSTSPANARFTQKMLEDAFRKALFEEPGAL